MASELSTNLAEIQLKLRQATKETATLIRRNVRKAVAASGASLTDAVRAKAAENGLEKASKATSMKVSFSVRSAGARISTNQKRAPYARPLELGSKKSGSPEENRHPVYAKKDTPAYENPKRWVNQRTRPYFFPTLKDGERPTEEALVAAVDVALAESGWHL